MALCQGRAADCSRRRHAKKRNTQEITSSKSKQKANPVIFFHFDPQGHNDNIIAVPVPTGTRSFEVRMFHNPVVRVSDGTLTRAAIVGRRSETVL